MQVKIRKPLKIFGKTFCIVSVLNGVCGIVVSSVAKSYEDSLLVDESLKSYKAFIPNLFYFLASVFIFTGILGIMVYSKMIKPFIIAFQIINFVLCISFLVIFILFLNKYNFIQAQLQYSNCQTGILKEVNTIFNKAKQIWCKDGASEYESCPCSIYNFSSWNQQQQILLLKKYGQIKPNGNKNLQNCYNIQSVIPNLSEYLQLLKSIESTYNCNGICDPGDLLYYFTNVNQVPPQQNSCFESIIVNILEWILIILTYSAISFSINIINILIYNLNKFFRLNLYQNATVLSDAELQNIRNQQRIENFTLNKLV
ncbi:tetraspanin family protein (macronuclear) [Tetrahymena thermophila SB210]|uniref:Tetraspanin family protein n=1 Tax=Tetrahymena thermophila (strain SB210) TaxID=312017 RepID=Q22W68_TETTS|nr:tetraspanin family protein [Tetrahymena thermophila SB210]EAR89549.2 tetraspanin family protein [Tetrahymena thermophila SB210]|eukprot:XP_001009794.2 tetraspanin family protein [Tetrahymena thermophila SB210]